VEVCAAAVVGVTVRLVIVDEAYATPVSATAMPLGMPASETPMFVPFVTAKLGVKPTSSEVWVRAAG